MINIEELIPHRNTMKLIDEIIEVDASRCITVSTVTPQWPTFADGFVSPIVLIELAAQTAGVSMGWDEMNSKSSAKAKIGWLVGIKYARFFTPEIPVCSKVMVSTESIKLEGTYTEISGIAKLDENTLAELVLQVFRPDTL